MARSTARDVTVQALCGFGVIPATPTPHKTVYLRPGETKTVTAHCSKGHFLVSGGFQRTDFRSDGGDYVTESRAQGTKAWTVSGHAYGTGSGELTAIAYCVRMKQPVIRRSPPLPLPWREGSATTTHAGLPVRQAAGRRRLQLERVDQRLLRGRSSMRTAPGRRRYWLLRRRPQLTAYGYCLPANSWRLAT